MKEKNKSKIMLTISSMLLIIVLFAIFVKAYFLYIILLCIVGYVLKVLYVGISKDKNEFFNKLTKSNIILFFLIFIILLFWIFIYFSHDYVGESISMFFVLITPLIALVVTKFYIDDKDITDSLIFSISLMLMYHAISFGNIAYINYSGSIELYRIHDYIPALFTISISLLVLIIGLTVLLKYLRARNLLNIKKMPFIIFVINVIFLGVYYYLLAYYFALLNTP